MPDRATSRPVATDRPSSSSPKRARRGTSPLASFATLILCLPTFGMAAGRLPPLLALTFLVLAVVVLVMLSHWVRTRSIRRRDKPRLQEDR